MKVRGEVVVVGIVLVRCLWVRMWLCVLLWVILIGKLHC